MKHPGALLFLAACLASIPAAQAQIGIGLPEIPAVGDILGQTAGLGEAVGGSLQDVRRLRIRDLLRTHRRELEAGPGGEPIVRGQIVALGASAAALEGARAGGFDVVRSDDAGELGAITTVRAPRGMSTRRALRRLREADPEGSYDFDHLYLESGAGPVVVALAQSGASNHGPRIGLIDSGVDAHPSLVGAIATQRAFAGETAAPASHGTAIASLLIATTPNARLYVADIYGGAPTGGASSSLARALVWLARERTPVINVSLVGSRNRVVELVVARIVARGLVIVAAVGNDGPAAAPLYPAAYEGVVGVTGVDARERVLIEAGRGAHVDFAAPGVVRVARGSETAPVRGTSYAAPIVAGLLARRLGAPDPQGAERALAALREHARDLGARGRDNVYGHGMVDARSDAFAAP